MFHNLNATIYTKPAKFLVIFKKKAHREETCRKNYRGVSPEGTLAAVAAGRARRAGMLAEVVVAGDGLSAEIAHEAAAAA